MKTKNFLLILTFIGSVITVNAQSFKKSTNIAATGLEMTNYFPSIFNTSDKSVIPVLSLQYERGMWNAGNNGVISLGAYAGFKKYSRSGKIESVKWDISIIGLRSAYHFTGIEKTDLYCGLMGSYKFAEADKNSGSDINITPYLGCRYLFADRVGFFAELSYKVSHVTVGIAIKY
jgi:hypothetical protein